MITLAFELCVYFYFFLNTIGFLKVNFTLILALSDEHLRHRLLRNHQNRLKDINKLTEYVIHIHTTLTATFQPPEPSKPMMTVLIVFILRIAELHTPQWLNFLLPILLNSRILIDDIEVRYMPF
jgi:hypothetical protein